MTSKMDELMRSHDEVTNLLLEAGCEVNSMDSTQENAFSSILDDLSNLRSMRRELRELEEKTLQLELYSLTPNVLNVELFEQRLLWCENVLSDLSSLSTNRYKLLHCVQQPVVTNCLNLHSSQHQDFEKVLVLICSLVSNICRNVILLQDSQKETLQPTLERAISQLARVHSSLRVGLNNIQDVTQQISC